MWSACRASEEKTSGSYYTTLRVVVVAVVVQSVYLLRLQLRERSIGTVDLLVQPAGVAQVVAGTVASPQRRARRAAVDALASLAGEVRRRI